MKISKNANFSDEYCATIVTIGDISPIDGKDRIVKTLVNGNSIVIGKNDFNTGDVAVYVSNECVIHELFLHLNNMYDEKELNADQTQKGYINNKGRVRVIRLGGIPSYGILLTPKSIAKFINEPEDSVVTFLNKHIGEDFDEINGERFCHVYVPPVKKDGSRQLSKDERNAKKLARFKMLIEGSFRFHYETKQLQKYIRFINPDDNVDISVKIHGCVDESTIINTIEFGDITIKEIVDNKIDCHIKAYNTETNSIEYVSIDDYYLLKNDGVWYEIELEDGRKLKITGNNPVWLPDLQCYRKTEELNVGDTLLID